MQQNKSHVPHSSETDRLVKYIMKTNVVPACAILFFKRKCCEIGEGVAL
jgi:hypothetical protein